MTNYESHAIDKRFGGAEVLRAGGLTWTVTDFHSQPLSSAALAANAALSLINLCTHLLDKQVEAQANAFEKEGGFTERLYRVRKQKRIMCPSVKVCLPSLSFSDGG